MKRIILILLLLTYSNLGSYNLNETVTAGEELPKITSLSIS